MTRNRKNFLLFGALALLGYLLFPLAAMAQDQMPQATDLAQYMGATGKGDLSLRIWDQLLGSFATNPFSQIGQAAGGGKEGKILPALFIIYNVAIFSVGVAWLSYGLVSSVVGTAQDGQALGQRINTAWYPIRVITGITGMLPVLGGFTLSQGLLMWIGTLSIGIANTMYNASIEQASMGLFGSSPMIRPVGQDMTRVSETLLKAAVCMQEYKNEEASRQETNAPAITEENFPRVSVIRSGGGASGALEVRFGSVNDPRLCGSVRVDKTTSTRGEDSAFGFRVKSVNYDAIATQVATAQLKVLEEAQGWIQELAAAWIASRNGSGEALKGLTGQAAGAAKLLADEGASGISVYITQRLAASLREQSAAAMNGKTNNQAIMTEAAANMRAQGWMALGGWFATFAEVNAALADAAGNITFTAVPAGVGPSAPRLIDRAYVSIKELDEQLKQAPPPGGSDAFGQVIKDSCRSGVLTSVTSFLPSSVQGAIQGAADSAMGTATGNCSIGQGMVALIIGSATAGSGGGTGGGRTFNPDGKLINPVIAMKNVGDYMMTLSSSIFFGSIADKMFKSPGVVGKVANVVGNAIPGVKPVVEALSGPAGTLMTTAGMLFFVAGAYMSLYIPMLPFIIWVGGLVAYCASFIEGLVAMPLHSMSHLSTEGEGMGQRTGHGYLFWLNTLARPPLMVIAFFLASGLVIGLGTMVTYMFMPAVANAQGNSVTGFFSILGYVVIYGVIMSILINACFDLIHVLPDQVIGFVGAGSVTTKLGTDAENKINHLFMASARLAPQAKDALDKTKRGGVGVAPSRPGTE